MFKDKKMKENATAPERNVIGKKTTIVGDIKSDGDFRIDGIVEGSVETKGRLIIGKEGEVRGNIDCSNADIEGTFSGELLVHNLLTLKATAKVEGNVQIGRLSVEPSAIFNVTCSMIGVVKELSKEKLEVEKIA